MLCLLERLGSAPGHAGATRSGVKTRARSCKVVRTAVGEENTHPSQLRMLRHTAWFRHTAQPSDPPQNPSLLQSHTDPSPCKWNFFMNSEALIVRCPSRRCLWIHHKTLPTSSKKACACVLSAANVPFATLTSSDCLELNLNC